MTTPNETLLSFEPNRRGGRRGAPEDDWRRHRACRAARDELFFPETGDSGNEPPYPAPEVEELCHFCPVRAECLEEGLYEPYGIWGGLTAYQRRQLTRPLERASCLGCGSTDVVVEHGQEICLACGISWNVI